MSVNRYLPHVFVLPEDDANRQLANGFLRDQSLLIRKIQVLPVVGGWAQVLECFQSEHVAGMDLYPERFMVLLMDFDDMAHRLQNAKDTIPARLANRVFVLGVLSRPEALRANLGSYETIGLALARDCREGTDCVWRHQLLRHNASELVRLRERVLPIVFPSEAGD